mmetsp:Transcript_432/g.1025  ORF Transcript_432/g.1025 Transcript_432/m.1025 type:complete len:209 (+) Transcript_432:1049-1675(+)
MGLWLTPYRCYDTISRSGTSRTPTGLTRKPMMDMIPKSTMVPTASLPSFFISLMSKKVDTLSSHSPLRTRDTMESSSSILALRKLPDTLLSEMPSGSATHPPLHCVRSRRRATLCYSTAKRPMAPSTNTACTAAALLLQAPSTALMFGSGTAPSLVRIRPRMARQRMMTLKSRCSFTMRVMSLLSSSGTTGPQRASFKFSSTPACTHQ